MIYLASPYYHPEEVVREFRYQTALACVAVMIKEGHCIFSPIVHCHHLHLHHSMPASHEFWLNYDLKMLTLASKMLVLKLPGWSESKGVAEETNFCLVNDIPLTRVDPESFLGEDYQHSFV